MPKTPSLYAHVDPNNFSYIHRLLWSFKHTERDFPDWDFELSLTDPHRPFDFYFLHSLFASFRNFGFISKWKRGGGQWVWSLDDALDRVPDWNPAKPTESESDTCIKLRATSVLLGRLTAAASPGVEHNIQSAVSSEW